MRRWLEVQADDVRRRPQIPLNNVSIPTIEHFEEDVIYLLGIGFRGIRRDESNWHPLCSCPIADRQKPLRSPKFCEGLEALSYSPLESNVPQRNPLGRPFCATDDPDVWRRSINALSIFRELEFLNELISQIGPPTGRNDKKMPAPVPFVRQPGEANTSVHMSSIGRR